MLWGSADNFVSGGVVEPHPPKLIDDAIPVEPDCQRREAQHRPTADHHLVLLVCVIHPGFDLEVSATVDLHDENLAVGQVELGVEISNASAGFRAQCLATRPGQSGTQGERAKVDLGERGPAWGWNAVAVAQRLVVLDPDNSSEGSERRTSRPL